ncbi:MAG: hypothetical protein LBG59_01465 [Candidatus Peribacteria bacterium]|jgi:hypothetical protein|nr:hypothetical protein [Candidatus Peribacteria bacterium]
MQQAKGRWVLLSQNYFFDPKDYRDYQFGENDSYTACIWRGDCSYGDSYYTEVTFTTDTLGKHTIQHHFPKEAATEKIYTFNMNLQDPDTQKTVQQYASVILHSTDGYVGIKSPYRIDQKS